MYVKARNRLSSVVYLSHSSNFRVHYGNGTDNDDDNVEQRIVHKTISDVHYPLCKLNLFAFSRCRLKLNSCSSFILLISRQ